ncbi:hypothetical protein FBQ82_00645 [Anaerolineae bacterium CFX7]|nr:hypothetical protein [Anaerolineae bacterium CFX7]
MWLGEQKVLSALLEHPYADPYWLGEYLGSRSYTTRALQSLKRRGYAQGFTFSRDAIALKRVWTITPEGVKALAKLRGVPSKTLARAYFYRRGRMAWIVLAMERVTRLRWWMKTLEGFNPPNVGRRNALVLKPLTLSFAPIWRWQIVSWQEEIFVRARNQRVGFTGAATLCHRENGRWLTLYIHVDDANVPIDAQRFKFARWMRAQQESAAFDSEGNLILSPLAVLAQDAYRLNEYATMFRAIALDQHLVVPNIYLALDENIKATRGNPAQPIWYNVNSGENKMLLADERGFEGELPASPWHPISPRVKHGKNSLVTPTFVIEASGVALDALAVTALTLSDTDHRLVRLIAAHPLLSAQDMTHLTTRYPSQIATALVRLIKFGFLERMTIPAHETLLESAQVETDNRKSKRKRETGFYVVTERGERYLAAVDGFATALAQYRQVNMWSPEQTQRRVREWTHTRLGNLLFVKLTRAAHARGFELDWVSESESRLYFSLNGERRAFLPDGRGVLHAGAKHIHFVVEIDTTRSNADKLRRKIARCYASVVARLVPDNVQEKTTILFITHSTERMNHLLHIAREIEAEMDPTRSSLRRVAPILLGQQQMIVNPRETIDRANWVDLDGKRVYCFSQFDSMTEPKTKSEIPKVIYKS